MRGVRLAAGDWQEAGGVMDAIEKQIFRSLAIAHPLEMYTAFPEEFWELFQKLRPNCSREHMELEMEKLNEPS